MCKIDSSLPEGLTVPTWRQRRCESGDTEGRWNSSDPLPATRHDAKQAYPTCIADVNLLTIDPGSQTSKRRPHKYHIENFTHLKRQVSNYTEGLRQRAAPDTGLSHRRVNTLRDGTSIDPRTCSRLPRQVWQRPLTVLDQAHQPSATPKGTTDPSNFRQRMTPRLTPSRWSPEQAYFYSSMFLAGMKVCTTPPLTS